MNAKPDTSPRNVRISKQKARQGNESAVATIMGYDIPVLADEDYDINSMKTPSSISIYLTWYKKWFNIGRIASSTNNTMVKSFSSIDIITITSI